MSEKDCFVCWVQGVDKLLCADIQILYGFRVCKKHKQEVDKHIMECGKCGSQDTKYITGISKKNGKKWAAYECNEPACTNDFGKPNRTFVPFGSKSNIAAAPSPKAVGVGAEVIKKLDLIIKHLGIKGAPLVTQEEITPEEPF